jgi:hypothetical protein
MKKKSMITTVGLCAVTLSVTLAGCNATKTEVKSEASSAASSAASGAASSSAAARPEMPAGPHKTIADYVNDNKIIETPFKKDEAGAPVFDFPTPPDWELAGADTPAWAYGAIVYKKAANPNDPPFVTAIISKLTGDVDPAKILEYAPGMLQNLPGYIQDGDVQKSTVSGFDSIKFQATYLRGDERRYIAQETIVVPGKDGAVFVVQANADAPQDQGQIVRDATTVINADTKITV